MNRALSAVVLTIALIGGTATVADAALDQRSATATGVAKIKPVPFCIASLRWAHDKGGERRADIAIQICSDVVKTKRQGARLYNWASRTPNNWALEYIG